MNVLVVSPHPDDETLGAGGTLLKYKAQRKNIYWLIISNIEEKYGYSKEQVERRNNEIKKVSELYDFTKVYNLKLFPAKLDSYDDNEIISKVSNVIKEVKPEEIILPYRNDVHSDHKKVFDCVYSCTKVFRYNFIKKILEMEILSETDFANTQYGYVPDYFVDISNYFDKKVQIIKEYKSEIGKHPYPRSVEGIEALAKIRGIAAGVKYAEAFKVVKIIE
ncbi:PIG-L deacetylase family protein [Clostridium sp. HCP1S3_B4]|uniref:PIG-L deacetylase family protein n=1 Tax=unclassified Clostridium TaxID=2614128 RepID=UPI003F8B1F69